jgi:hypothetical protein
LPDQTTDTSRLVAATVNRLRLIQVDFADQPKDVRDNYLTDEVEHALARLLPDQRTGFLQELKDRFPTWDGQVAVGGLGESASTRSATDNRELQDFTFLVSRLVQLAPTLTEEQRKTTIARLRDAGLGDQGAGPGEWPAQPAKVLRTKLGMTDKDKLDATRLLELTAELVSFAASLDQLVWATWKQVAPKSDMKRPGMIQRTCAKFASGDTQETSRTQIAADVDRLRQLTAGLISAIAQAGNLFAQRHVSKFSVMNIEAYADKVPGIMVGKEVKCWRQYKELAAGMDVQTIEKEIQDAIAEYTETLIKGRSRA